MPLLGAHMSVAGGLYKAADAAAGLGMEALQIFTHSPSQWSVKPFVTTGLSPTKDGQVVNGWEFRRLDDRDVGRFQESVARHQLATSVHVSYLINLAATDDFLWRRSVAALAGELLRADQLGIPYVVLHPGAFTSGTEESGLTRVAQGLDEAHVQVPSVRASCLLENTAGQGTCLGWRFEHLAAIIERAKCGDRIGVCFDTCHAFAAGYGLGTLGEYRQTWREFESTIGLDRLGAFHLNDSKREQGSRVDRHEAIGDGCLGLNPFKRLLNDRRFSRLPMILETPKGRREGHDLDAINLATLKSLISHKSGQISRGGGARPC